MQQRCSLSLTYNKPAKLIIFAGNNNNKPVQFLIYGTTHF